MPKTLLLADDSVTIQKVVGITFANEDVELVTVDNGTDALARAKQVFPDLVLADVGMPGLDGYELCAAIRRVPELAHVPVLLLTGTFESYDEERARSAGANGQISKPFEAQALVDRVWQLLAEAEAMHEATRVADPLASAPAPAAPQTSADDDPFEGLPELPNSDFGSIRFSPPPLPSPSAADLFDLAPSPPPLVDPFGDEEAHSGARAGRTSPWGDSGSFGPPGADPRGGETAFLDPLEDLAPPIAEVKPPKSSAAVLPPAEVPDFLDMGTLESGDDTNPTYADGSSIPTDDSGLDPGIASGESIAVLVPETEPPSNRAEAIGPGSSVMDLEPLPEADPIDVEPLQAADPNDTTLTSHASGPQRPSPDAETVPPLAAPDDEPARVRAGVPQVDREALHSALEKVAWEAFGSISQELVEQFTRRIESILWEVVPALTERLVREEIARLKGEP